MDWDNICRRAGGRRKYNRARQLRTEHRLTQVVQLLKEIGFCDGYETRIAESRGISRATICRDMSKVFRRYWGGKEVEWQDGARERMQRRIRTEEQLELDRMASEQAAPEGHAATPASPQPVVPPPTMAPAQAIFAPR